MDIVKIKMPVPRTLISNSLVKKIIKPDNKLVKFQHPNQNNWKVQNQDHLFNSNKYNNVNQYEFTEKKRKNYLWNIKK